MPVTVSGMVTLVRLAQFWNAASPMTATLAGSVKLAKLVQPENA